MLPGALCAVLTPPSGQTVDVRVSRVGETGTKSKITLTEALQITSQHYV